MVLDLFFCKSGVSFHITVYVLDAMHTKYVFALTWGVETLERA